MEELLPFTPCPIASALADRAKSLLAIRIGRGGDTFFYNKCINSNHIMTCVGLCDATTLRSGMRETYFRIILRLGTKCSNFGLTKELTKKAGYRVEFLH